MSTRTRIFDVFDRDADDDWGLIVTAAGIQRLIRLEFNERVKLSSLSSELNSLVKEGRLLRIDGFGIRGGYGYCVPNPRRSAKVLKSIAERASAYR